MRTSSMRSFIRFRQRSSVDLPQPDGPMNAVTWLAGRSSEMSCSACFSPYQRFALRISIAFGRPCGTAVAEPDVRLDSKPAVARQFRVSHDPQNADVWYRRRSRLRTMIAVRLSSTTMSSSRIDVAYTIGFAASTLGLWKPTS